MPEPTTPRDPRIHTDLAHLRKLAGSARALSFLPRQPARSALNGRHASRLRGRGLNFEELRNYQVGDDPRTIDWKVTARTGEPYVRVYTEERDRPALLLVDQRMSMFYGSQRNMKSVTAAEAAALAAFRIRAQGDRVGGIVFTDDTLAELRPKASNVALNRLLTCIADANCALHAEREVTRSMPLNRPLEAAARIATTGNLILVFSDFAEVDDKTERLVRRLAQHNDVILFPVSDPSGLSLPEDFRIVASDGTLQVELDAREAETMRRVEEVVGSRIARAIGWTRKYGVPVLPLSAGRETLPQLMELMGLRGGR
ncbi:DUF58 domain-containing protein [Aliiruegeria sabulilitoris]|uniref:DUF58 domain-containing protein n=1 Tax=Aliiruegeria sabulilitoris TaxID=1510458 RepID=UPI00082E63FE|nr:DUF58 domain-containing protein [Aliiruegeria sabulilitoris]NDR58163.1 DUF58 domain-containing protein [Pseudoruegeria sp. M32A2M]